MAQEIIARGRQRGWLLEPEAKELCRAYGLPVGEWRVANRESDALSCSAELGFPLAMKIVSPDIVHKSDVGGVILGIDSPEKVIDAFGRMMGVAERTGSRFEGVLMERMARAGVETIIGAKRDPQFGPVIMFGVGGIFVEIFKDVAFRVAPIDRSDAMEMINELKALPLLKGIRGRKPVDLESLADALIRAAKLMTENQEVSEIDLNPTMGYEDGCKVVDARIILRRV
ncbi:MAG TPA: acetate--CoA ligase family protein [Candidatus Methanomethylicus sp.]|nr:acetate--CoA ligase family protein [Candidatus Methanomethylicus sp.]